MNLSLNRIILFVRDVKLLKKFYQEYLGLQTTEEISGEWVVLKGR